MQEAGYVVCATCGDYAVDFNAVMLDCSTCENSYHHTCVGMGLGELGRRTAATNAMRKKGKKGGADGDGDVTGTLYDWRCPDCHQQQQPRVPEPDKDEVLVIEDTDDEDEDDGERTTYIDLSYNVDIHRVAPSQRALLPTTTARRPAVHMQNVAGLLNRTNTNVGASTSRAADSNSNIGASASTSTSKPGPASTPTSTSPQSHNATTGATTTRNVQTPLSPPPSRSPSRTGPIAPVPFVDFTAMATSSKKRRRSSEVGEGGLDDERAKKKSRLAGPAALLRTPVEPIDLTLSDDEVLVTPAAPSTSSRRDAASISSAGSRSRSRHGPGSVSSGTTDIATEDEPVPTRNLMRASLAGRTPRVPLPLASSVVAARGTAASSSTTRPATSSSTTHPAASSSTTRPTASSSTTRPVPSPTASSRSRSTVPSKRRLSASPSSSHSHPAPVKRAVVQNPEHEDDDDEEHAFFSSRRTSGGLTRTRSDAAVLSASTSTAPPRSTAPTRTQSDSALPLSASARDDRKTPTADDSPPAHVSDEEQAASATRPVLASSASTAPTSTSTSTRTAPSSSRPLASSAARGPMLASSTSTAPASSKSTTSSSSHPLESSAPREPRAIQAVDDGLKKTSVAMHDVDVDDLPDYVSDDEHERERVSATLPAASTALSAPTPASRAPAARPTPTLTPATTTSAGTTTVTKTTFRKPALPPPRAAPIPSTPPVPSTVPVPSTPAVPVHSSTSASQSQPLFLPDSPSPSPERRERESQRLMSLPPISFLDEEEVDVEIGSVGAGVEEDELEDEDEDGGGGGVGVVRKKKGKRTDGEGSMAGKEKARHAPAPATDDSVVKKKLFDRTAAGPDVSTGFKKETTHRHEDEEGAGPSYAQQVVDERLDAMDLPPTGLSALLDRESSSEKKHREREGDAGPLARPVLGLSESTTHLAAHAGVGVDGGEGEASTSGSVTVKKKKKHRDRDQDATQGALARPAQGLSASLEKLKHVDAGEGELSTSGSTKEKKKHRNRAQDAVDPLARPALDPAASLEKTNKRKHLDTDVGVGESSTSGSVKEKKKKKHRDRDQDAVDLLAVPSLGLSTSASLEKKNKQKHPDTDVGEGEASTSSSVKVKKKKHRDGDSGAGRSSTQGEGAGEQIDLLARTMIGLPGSFKNTVLGADVEAGESSTSSSVKKKKKHRERERDAADGAVPSQKTPTFKEPATPDRRVGDLTVSWGRLQELASFSPSSAKNTTGHMDVDGDSLHSSVREEASSSRQLGRKTARPPLLDDSPSLMLDKRSTVSSASTRSPLAAMSAAKQPLPPARVPASAGVPSSTAPASSSASRPDADKQKQKEKEKQPMQMQRARKTVSRREDPDAAPPPGQVKARVPAPSSSAVPERTKAAVALDRADGQDAPGKGKSTLDKYSARAVASSSFLSTVLPPSTSTLPLSSRSAAAVRDPLNSRPSAPSTAPSSSRSKHRVADPSLPFEAPVVPRRKAIAGVDYPLPDLPISPTKAKSNKKPTARKVPRDALLSDEETPMDVDVDVDVRVHTSRKGKEKEQGINVDDDSAPNEKTRPESRPKPPPIPRLRSASIWSSSTPTPAPYTTSSPSLDAVTAFLKKRRMANPLPSSSTLPSAPTQGQKMAATKRRLERGEHESDLPVPMSVLANAREMQTLRRLVKRSIVVKGEDRVGEVKSDVVTAFDWAKYRAELERKEKEKDEQGVEDFATT